ncbi:Cyclin-T2 [Chionoecetes opilio]|uniref:Cyclin-T2 n=1 Tax=Chionoecetes opilio TaxID=41210 RepID=A0A8J4YQY9_CHIOP|nr:Cyclin-T2 [Chionoecetes opilio]
MAAEERWYFTKEELNNSPSRRCGIDAEKELSYRQQGANLIQDMGQRLQVNQLAINTAIVYMHRFYMFHPFTRFHRNAIAPAALFLAAKVEEQPRKLEHVIKVAYHCLFRDQPPLDTQSEGYLERAQELVVNENILLQTLGFDVAIDHPHTHVVRCCHLVRATKDLAQTSYFMATSSLHMTTMCLQYKPTVVACVCIYIVCTWSHYEIQRATEGKDWFWYVDKTVTLELLETLTAEFLAILDKCPNRLKKIMNSLQHTEDRGRTSQPGSSTATPVRSALPATPQPAAVVSHVHETHNSHSKTAAKVPPSQAHQHQPTSKLNLKEYNEKREKERREREKMRDRDILDPRESKQFALVSTSHTSQVVSSAVATIASSQAALHSGLPVRSSKSSKSSSGRGTSHPEHLKATAAHSSNHKTHGHTAAQVVRDLQPSLESLRVTADTPRQEQQQQQMQQQRREQSARSDSERYDKGSRTSSSAVDGRLQGDVKPSVSDIRQQQLLDVKPSRQSLDSTLLERKKEIKLEQKSVERKPPEPKQEPSKVKMEVKAEPKEEVKSQYNTIFNNSDLPDFALADFMNDNTFLNLSDGPPDQLFDNSDTETKPDISAIIEDNSLLAPPPQQKSKSPVSCQQPQVPVPPTQHHHASHNAVANVSGASGNSELRVSENATPTTVTNHHSARHHSTTNGSVPASQPTHATPVSSKSSSKRAAREAEKKNAERAVAEVELVPMVTKLEDTRYRTALSDPATPIKVRGEAAANAAAASNASKQPPAPATSLSTPSVPAEPPQKPAVEPVLRLKVPQPEQPKEAPADPAVGVAVGGGAVITEHKKHKNEHPHHKHKEKKKHKHKEKEKHKDKEHKEHKEHKEKKKHKKHKDKEKDRDKASRTAAGEAGTAPIKITIPKDKIMYTPKAAAVPLRTHAASAPPAVANAAAATPSIPKFKIDKSKLNKKDLFGGASSTSPESSPAGDLARDTPTTSIKIKISREYLRPDKESKKRDRDHSPGEVPVAKIPRNGSEVRSGHAAPQVGLGVGVGQPQPAVGVGVGQPQPAAPVQVVSHPPTPQQQPRKPFPRHPRGRGIRHPEYRSLHSHPAGMMPMLQPRPNPPYTQFYQYPPIPPPNFNYPPPAYHLPHLHHPAPPVPYMQAPPPPPPPPPPTPTPTPMYIPQHPMPPPCLPSDPPLPSEPPPPTPPPPPPPE